MMTPQQFVDMYKNASVEDRRCMIDALTQRYVVAFPYYSAIMLSAPRVGLAGNPGTYTLVAGAPQAVRAFSYAYDTGNANTAGFPAGMIATRSDTNLASPNETNSADVVEIHGIALQVIPSFVRAVVDTVGPYVQDQLSDSRWLAALSGAVRVELRLNASEGYNLGIMPMLPGAGGFEGGGIDQLGEQAIQGGRLPFGFSVNGRPQTNNYFALPEGIVWLPKGQRDSMLNVVFEPTRNIIVYTGGDLANNVGDEAGAAGIRGFAYPVTIGTAIMVHLQGRVIGERSNVT